MPWTVKTLEPAEASLEPYYWRAWGQALFELAKKADGPTRQALMAEAARLGAEAAARRPAHATGWHILGTSLGMLRVYGGPDRLDEAEAALDKAFALDWSAPGTIENRMKVARLRGDARTLRDCEAALARLKLLTASP